MKEREQASMGVHGSRFLRRPRWTLALVTLLAASTPGEEADYPDAGYIDRFRLHGDCAPMGFYVIGFPDDELTALGLTKDSVEVLVRSRLRAARLYDTDDTEAHHLFIAVGAVGPAAFSVSVEFRKPVYDYASESLGPATTWDRAFFGTHGRDPSYIRESLSQLMDIFLDGYLRVNEDACAKPANSN